MASVETAGAVPGRVLRVERGSAVVVTADGECVAATDQPAPTDQPARDWVPAVGDWVMLASDDAGYRVTAVLPRWSELARLRDERQVLAANVDLVLVTAPADRLSPARVERELVVAWDSGARPVVVVTKVDVGPPGVVDDLAGRLGTVEVIRTSATTGAGLDQVRALLAGPATAVLLGPSGAGKSTLINALLGEERLAVGAVRSSDHRGRHTTTWRELVPVPTGGAVIDMPGLRALALDVDDSAVIAAFDDIHDLAAGCRFDDCSHGVEPGCAVAAAVDEGALDARRLASFLKLQREVAYDDRRRDPVARRNEVQRWKAITKAAKAAARRKRPGSDR